MSGFTIMNEWIISVFEYEMMRNTICDINVIKNLMFRSRAQSLGNNNHLLNRRPKYMSRISLWPTPRNKVNLNRHYVITLYMLSNINRTILLRVFTDISNDSHDKQNLWSHFRKTYFDIYFNEIRVKCK